MEIKTKKYYEYMLKKCEDKDCTARNLYEKIIPCKKCFIIRECKKRFGYNLFKYND